MTNFEAASLIIQIVVAAAAFLSVWLVLRQLRSMNTQIEATQHASEVQSIISIVNFLQAAETRESRRVVRAELPKIHFESWSDAQKQHASSVCANYDVVASLLRSGLIKNSQIIADNWGASIRHCHKILSPHIDATRRETGGASGYWRNFEWLKDQCSDHKA